MSLLKKINSPDEIKKLNNEEITELSAEIREFLVENVLNCGGHLASNLGIVELTLALHYVFDCPEDKFVFDVGHPLLNPTFNVSIGEIHSKPSVTEPGRIRWPHRWGSES